MPHFHLHMRHGLDRVDDREGAEYKSLMSARTEALAAAREIMGRQVDAPERIADASRFEIADQGGEVWLVVSFLEAASP